VKHIDRGTEQGLTDRAEIAPFFTRSVMLGFVLSRKRFTLPICLYPEDLTAEYSVESESRTTTAQEEKISIPLSFPLGMSRSLADITNPTRQATFLVHLVRELSGTSIGMVKK
jgi:hypothetical protein